MPGGRIADRVASAASGYMPDAQQINALVAEAREELAAWRALRQRLQAALAAALTQADTPPIDRPATENP